MTIPYTSHGEFTDKTYGVVYRGIQDVTSKADSALVGMQSVIDDMVDLLNSLGDVNQITTTLGDLETVVDPFKYPAPVIRPTIDTTYPTQGALSPVTSNFPALGGMYGLNPQFDTKPSDPGIISDFPTPPTSIAVNPSFPADPGNAEVGSVDSLVLDPVPVLTTTEPVIRTITPPAPFTGTAPVPVDLAEHPLPDVPQYTLPAAPIQRVLILPTPPSIIDVAFDGILPPALESPPSVDFQFAEVLYQSVLTDQLKSSLLDLVLNVRQSGLSDAVEEQLLTPHRERADAESRRLRASVRRQFASLGWALPPGDETRELARMEEVASATVMDASRDIMVMRANLEQSNFQFAFTQAISLEGKLMDLHNSVQQRVFEAARYTIDAAISLYNAKVAYYNAGVALYKVTAEVYSARIQAELAKIELYKGQLEGQRLIAELNRMDIDLYKAQIESIIAIFDLYKDQLEAVKILLEQDSLKIQQFEANIRAFSETIKAKALEYEGYTAEVQGEKTKAEIFSEIVNAFKSRVEAFKVSTDAKVQKLDSDIKIQYDVPLKIHELNVDVYKAKSQAEAWRVDAFNTINKTLQEIFGIQTEAEKSRITAETDVYKTQVDAYKAANEAQGIELTAYNEANKTTAAVLDTETNAEAKRLGSIVDTNRQIVETFKTATEAKTAQIDGLVRVYEADTSVYAKNVEAEGTRINAQVSVQKNELDILVARANKEIEALKANYQLFLSQKDLILGTTKDIARIQAQLVASFGSAVQYGARLGSDANYLDQHSTEHRYSLSESV